MDELSAKKKTAIIRDWLLGKSLERIAAENAVSKGSVFNTIDDFRNRRTPELATPSEVIETVRELAVELQRSGLTPVQCRVGAALLDRVTELGLTPEDLERLPALFKLFPSGDSHQEILKNILGIAEVQKRSGLSLGELVDKAAELERKAAELRPLASQCEDFEKQIAERTGRRDELDREIAALERKRQSLKPKVETLEKKENDLTRHNKSLETTAAAAEANLSTLKQAEQRLHGTGLDLEGLTQFTHELESVARRHHIPPAELKSRLFIELKNLDKGLTLEVLNRKKQTELKKSDELLDAKKARQEKLEVIITGLEKQKTNLEADIETKKIRIVGELSSLVPSARNAINHFALELERGVQEILQEVRKTCDEAFEAGGKMGQSEELIRANE